jgi:hypothetical protein
MEENQNPKEQRLDRQFLRSLMNKLAKEEGRQPQPFMLPPDLPPFQPDPNLDANSLLLSSRWSLEHLSPEDAYRMRRLVESLLSRTSSQDDQALLRDFLERIPGSSARRSHSNEETPSPGQEPSSE